MTDWKAKTDEFVRKTEGFGKGPKQKMKASIEDMKTMIDRIDRTLDRLESECPVNWDSEKSEIEETMSALRLRWNDTASYSPDDFE
jgi:hypothetical protein